MAQRRGTFSFQSFYHIYNRGTDKRVIFQDLADHYRFIELLYISNSIKAFNIRDIRSEFESVFDVDRGDELVAISAYCLMPNHFHILMTPLIESGIQIFMRKVSTGYSMYFNKRYDRTGVLFQGRYKSQFVESDQYLKYLYSYIHLNPLKLIQNDWKERGLKNIPEAIKYLDAYKYSSYLDYTGVERGESKILNKNPFPLYFANKDAFQKELADWMYSQTSP